LLLRVGRWGRLLGGGKADATDKRQRERAAGLSAYWRL
jgi:hypothetical protein